MHIRKIAFQFFLVCFFIVSVALWFTTWYSVHVFKKYYLNETIENVESRAFLIKREIIPFITSGSISDSLDSLCKLLGRNISTRITVVLPSGKVIGDSQADPDSMENHANRPEIIEALKGGEMATQQRFSSTMHEQMLYIATPVISKDSLKAVLRLAVSLKTIKQQENTFYFSVLLASLLIFTVLVIASYLLSLQISKPILEIKDGAHRFTKGDLNFKLVIPTSQELGELAKSLNLMASTLNDRIQTVTRQRNELKAILTSMTEGVIAVDSREHIISINPSAEKLFGVTESVVINKWIHEVIRNANLDRFLTHVMTSDTIVETTFSLHALEGELHINATGTILGDKNRGPEGAVLVFNDITRLRQLENIRKDFVSNVSHELRTPLTSIKGFVETILSGNYSFPEEVSRFLEIIASKTDRLCSIADDILSLSSIERDQEYQEIEIAEGDIKSVLEDAIRSCTGKARKKNIAINLNISLPLRLGMNAQLIEQAVTNLLDNAIKYSGEGKPISIEAVQQEKSIIIRIQDQGIGIPHEHLNRIFERFYRVDKARSRKLGGTGLGLSIVKNIIIAHGGQVTVESEPGKGSTFRIVLPIVSENKGQRNDSK
jgi:two-component system phosphate regulon sensor histidine kinase PhoR